MSEWITRGTQLLNSLSDGNPMIAGALTMWLMGVATYLARGVPTKIWEFLKRQLTTSMTLNDAGFAERRIAVKFYSWLAPFIKESFTRTLAVQSAAQTYSDAHTVLGVGYGIHFFWYNKRLFWLYKSALESSGSEIQKESIVVTTFGRSHKPFQNIMNQLVPKKKKYEQISLFNADRDGEWDSVTNVPVRHIDTVAMDADVKATFVNQIKTFTEDKEWYYSKGLPYKVTYLLHGPPGSGKTSLVKALASYCGFNICTLNLQGQTDDRLVTLMSTVPKKSVVVIEDFDSFAVTDARHAAPSVPGSTEAHGSTPQMGLTLSGLLNVLDGVNPLDDCIIVLTTNHLEHIDPALYRPGRVDYLVYMDKVGPDAVRAYAKVIYPEYDWSTVVFQDTLGCWLNEALLEGKKDPEVFIKCLQKHYVQENQQLKSA